MAGAVYKYSDFMDTYFPFKLERISRHKYNRVLHSHEHMQICYIRRGECEHIWKGKPVALKKGDLFSIPPFMEHRVQPKGSKDFELIQIDFMPFIWSHHETVNPDLSCMPLFVSETHRLCSKFPLSAPLQQQVEHMIDTMWKEWTDKEENYELAIAIELQKLMIAVSREYKRSQQQSQPGNVVYSHRATLQDAFSYLDQHLYEDVHLGKLSEIAHMAPSYFSIVFKQVKGKPFVDYVNEARICKAMELLRHSGMTVTEIYMETGYRNLSHFNRMFKKMTGLTPTEYRGGCLQTEK